MQKENKTYQEIQPVCHPGSLLAGVSLGYERKGNEQAICIGKKSAGDPGQEPSGMTPYFTTIRGFTLIELLVVVLIIGILAAVALPQYQKAVEKSKSIQALTLLKAVTIAQQTYYLEHGEYATKFAQLDIKIPWTDNTKWRNAADDTISNKEWSLQLFSQPAYGLTVPDIYIGRISGPYQGAGFGVRLVDVANDAPQIKWSVNQIYCLERHTEGIAFGKDSGDYCISILKGKTKNTGGSLTLSVFEI